MPTPPRGNQFPSGYPPQPGGYQPQGGYPPPNGSQPPQKKNSTAVIILSVLVAFLVILLLFIVFAISGDGDNDEVAATSSAPSQAETTAQNGTPSSTDGRANTGKSPQKPSAAAGAAAGAGAGAGAAAGGSSLPTNAIAASSVAHSDYGDLAVLQSPTGNIICGITGPSQYDDGNVRCKIGNYTTDAPYGRDNDFGPDMHPVKDHVSIAGGTATLHGVTDADPWFDGDGFVVQPEVVEYGGAAVGFGHFICGSEVEGMTCWDTNSGHGAFMSAQETRLF